MDRRKFLKIAGIAGFGISIPKELRAVLHVNDPDIVIANSDAHFADRFALRGP